MHTPRGELPPYDSRKLLARPLFRALRSCRPAACCLRANAPLAAARALSTPLAPSFVASPVLPAAFPARRAAAAQPGAGQEPRWRRAAGGDGIC